MSTRSLAACSCTYWSKASKEDEGQYGRRSRFNQADVGVRRDDDERCRQLRVCSRPFDECHWTEFPGTAVVDVVPIPTISLRRYIALLHFAKPFESR